MRERGRAECRRRGGDVPRLAGLLHRHPAYMVAVLAPRRSWRLAVRMHHPCRQEKAAVVAIVAGRCRQVGRAGLVGVVRVSW